MRIRSIRVYQVDVPMRQGEFKISGGRTVSCLDSTIVEIETDDGTVGIGESCPFGAAYDPVFAYGVRSALALLAPDYLKQELLGQWRRLMSLNSRAAQVPDRF